MNPNNSIDTTLQVMILAAEIQMKNRAGKVVGRADTTGNQRTAAEAVEPVGRTRFRNRRVAGKTTGEQRKAQKGYMKQECKHQQQTGEEPHNLTNLKLRIAQIWSLQQV